jgi:N-acetylglucosaminyl-diphospho-decaprenol L-rhamnosyltransferase
VTDASLSAPCRRVQSAHMSFDVIVITYHSAESLKTCIGSLRPFFAETDVSMIAVDNASEDGSADEMARIWPGATVIRNPVNVGFAAAVNQAVAAGTGDVIVLVNPDARVIGGAWGDAATRFADDERIAAVACAMVLPDGSLARSCHASPTVFAMISESLALHERFPSWRRAGRYRMLDWDMTTSREVDDASGGFLLLRRAALRDVGPFDERFFLYYEETDWLCRARQRGWRVMFTPDIVVEHLGGQSTSEPTGVLSRHLLQSGYRYLRKHEGLLKEMEARFALGTIEALRIGWHLLHVRSAGSRNKLAAALQRMSVHAGVETGGTGPGTR